MEILYPPTLIPSLKNKHLLLDTNVFRDVAVKPTVFIDFFSELKRADVTIVTTDMVKFELLKGSSSETKYAEREKHVNSIVDITLPTTAKTTELTYSLIKRYGIDGAALSFTDLYLGAMLMQYPKNLYLLTRDTTDFKSTIFDLVFVINVPHAKGILTYRVYTYVK